VLRSRLEDLQDRASWLRTHAALGRGLRLALEEWGAPAWRPCGDLSFRSWTAVHGGEEARLLLALLDEALERRAAEIAAREAAGGEA
jgi:hypothetical protein